MTPTVFFTLIIVVFNGVEVKSITRDFNGDGGELLCKAAESAMHDMAKIAIGVTDVGTKCLRSEFSPLIKPRT